jgi:hypothetical protein
MRVKLSCRHLPDGVYVSSVCAIPSPFGGVHGLAIRLIVNYNCSKANAGLWTMSTTAPRYSQQEGETQHHHAGFITNKRVIERIDKQGRISSNGSRRKNVKTLHA